MHIALHCTFCGCKLETSSKHFPIELLSGKFHNLDAKGKDFTCTFVCVDCKYLDTFPTIKRKRIEEDPNYNINGYIYKYYTLRMYTNKWRTMRIGEK